MICLLLGHSWFPTVLTETAYQPVDDDYHRRGLFKERICVRCQKNEAVWVKDILTYFPYPYANNEGDLVKITAPRTYRLLQGDW